MRRGELTTDLEWISRLEAYVRKLENCNAELLAACKIARRWVESCSRSDCQEDECIATREIEAAIKQAES